MSVIQESSHFLSVVVFIICQQQEEDEEDEDWKRDNVSVCNPISILRHEAIYQAAFDKHSKD